MPLIDIPGPEAVQTRKSNPFGTWGNRLSPNRVEPIAKPHFAVPFRIEPGEKIFTVGSCFARNVEIELMRRGFSLPMRDLFKQPAFEGLDPGVVNNFGTPSIWNEFAWALDEQPFVEADNFVEAMPGKFVDLHVISSIRPDRFDVVSARRAAIRAAYRSVLECRVVIMTLGLVEVWFDRKTGFYLNAAPLPRVLAENPDRFHLHVLSFEEIYDHLERALLLVRAKGRSDVHVILTVSPVPLITTHRPVDVMVANSYSKSVLRAAAETICARHDFITYYPSYESVTLSDRRRVWKDDLTHVTEEIVAVNVGRMIDAYVGGGADGDELAVEIERGGVAVAVEKAEAARGGSGQVADAFFTRFGGFSKESLDFALQHAQFLAAERRHEEAWAVLAAAPGGRSDDRSLVLAGDCLVRIGRPQEAQALIEGALAENPRIKSGAVWNLLLNATMAGGDVDKILSVVARWTKIAPRRAGRLSGQVGKWFHDHGDFERALEYFKIAEAQDPIDATIRIWHVNTLLTVGRAEEAKTAFAAITPNTPGETVQYQRLGQVVGGL